MRKSIKILLFAVCGLTIQTAFNACCPVAFNQLVVTETTNLKKSTLDLVAKAGENFSAHEAKAMELKTMMMNRQTAAEADKCDKQVAKMWRLMLDEERNLYGGFVQLWQAQGTLSKDFIKEYKNELGANFDRILTLEKEKKKS